MNRSLKNKTPKCFGLILGIYTLCHTVLATEMDYQSLIRSPDKIRSLLETGKLFQVDVPNPHWQQDGCIACHTNASAPDQHNLRAKDDKHLCENCHNEFSKASFIHPTGMQLPDDMWNEMPTVFKKSLLTLGGNIGRTVSCQSCHDLKIQCLDKDFSQRAFNTLFFRLGPFQNRVELCFYCHDPRFYKRFTPHKQIEEGELDKEKCRICHRNENQLTSSTPTKDIELHNPEDLNKLCINCHPWRPHPGWEFAVRKKKDANHLVKPSDEVFQRMQLNQQQTGVQLPLEPDTGEIYCATCHNPHEKGVIETDNANLGADSDKRMRLKEACNYCHDY